MEIGTDEEPQHWHADVGDNVGGRLNWLRAAVLGANDGIVSTAGVLMGVAGATDENAPLFIAGVAALVAGALSMGTGEYVSVSTQRDSERSMLAMEATELARMPQTELAELASMLEDKGLAPETARRAAEEMTAHDALAAHADIEFGLDPDNLTNPWHAAWASMVAFTIGALLPLLVVLLVPRDIRILTTVLGVAAALALTGFASARLGYSPWGRAMLRNVGGGTLAMGITYLIGMAVGTQL